VLVSACTTFAVRCPHCGKLEMTHLSRFALGRGGSVKVTCSCGHHQLTVGVRQGQVWLQMPCYLCDGVHFLYFNPDKFWCEDLKQIPCSETELQLGVFGGENVVTSYARPGSSELERLLEDAAFDDYFDEPVIMYQALSQIHHLSEGGNLTCTCGNQEISVDIFPDRLELSCPECGRLKGVPAMTEEDLARLQRLTCIQVGDDTPNRRKGHKK